MEVDHVYTWVNSFDPEVSALRARYSGEVQKDHAYRTGPARTTDHGELRLSLETARRYLPFVRNTYILGSGAAPSWLPDFGPSVMYVPQGDVVPPALWPNFQSNVVESFVHRIPGLAEHYIYSNDDFFFSQPHTVSDFFTSDGRTRVALGRTAAATGIEPTYRAVEENGIRALVKHVSLPKFETGLASISKQPAIRSRAKLLAQRINFARRGLRQVNMIAHVSQPYLKSEWSAFHEVFQNELQEVFQRRFRSEHAVGVNFLYHYLLLHREKAEVYLGTLYYLLSRDVGDREHFVRRMFDDPEPVRRFCLNDTPSEGSDGWPEFVQTIGARLRERDEAKQLAPASL